MGTANITLGSAVIGLDKPIVPSDEPWTSRSFRGRISLDDARWLERGMRDRPPAVYDLRVPGEPKWSAMVRTIETIVGLETYPALAVVIHLVRYVPPLIPSSPPCYCFACDGSPAIRSRMYLCGTCGNKRCPHATDHRLACTGSNEGGQDGSVYE